MTQTHAKAQPQAAQDVSVGHTKDHTERDADRMADQATDRMGLRYPRGPSSSSDPMGGEAAPQSAIAATESGGQPLGAETRRTMEHGFGQDFSNVRIHDGPEAARAASDVGASAYALGQDIVFGQDMFQPDNPAGAALLSHELAHTTSHEAEPTIRRGPSGWEMFLRHLGLGTIREAELEPYLDRLRGDATEITPGSKADQGKIEDEIDSDDKAREVVKRDLHNAEPIRVRALLIQEMLSGVVTEADEEAIIKILQDAHKAAVGDFHEIIKIVGSKTLEDNLSGKEYYDFLDLFSKYSKAKKKDDVPGVPLDWDLNYNISGLNKTVGNAGQGLFIRSATSKPTAHPATEITTGKHVVAQDTELGSDINHERDRSGELFVDAMPGAVNGDKVDTVGGVQQVSAQYPKISHHYDKATVELDLVYEERLAEVAKKSDTKGSGTETGTDTAHTDGKHDSKITGSETTTGTDQTDTLTKKKEVGAEVGQSAKIKREKSRSKERTEGTFKQKGNSSHEGSSESNTNKKETDTHDLERNKTGTHKTTGDVKINFDDLSFSASQIQKIWGDLKVNKGETSITRDFVDLTKPVQDWVIDKVVDRYLGPLGDYVSDPAKKLRDVVVDYFVEKPPDWTVTFSANGTSTVTGSMSGDVVAKVDLVKEIKEKEKETGTVKREGTAKTDTTSKGTGKSTLTGDSTATSDKTTDSVGAERGADVRKKASKSVSRSRSKTDVHRDTNSEATETGTSSSDTTTNIDRKTKFGSKTAGKDTNIYEAVFKSANLRVKLTGQNGRYLKSSEPGQRGGGAAQPKEQKRGNE